VVMNSLRLLFGGQGRSHHGANPRTTSRAAEDS
jgi:hypothetical protein